MEKIAVFCSRRSGSQPFGTTLSNGEQLFDTDIDVPAALFPLETLTQREGDRAGHGLARKPGELAGKSLRS